MKTQLLKNVWHVLSRTVSTVKLTQLVNLAAVVQILRLLFQVTINNAAKPKIVKYVIMTDGYVMFAMITHIIKTMDHLPKIIVSPLALLDITKIIPIPQGTVFSAH